MNTKKRPKKDLLFYRFYQNSSLCIIGWWNWEVSSKSNLALPGGHCAGLCRDHLLPQKLLKSHLKVIELPLRVHQVVSLDLLVSICPQVHTESNPYAMESKSLITRARHSNTLNSPGSVSWNKRVPFPLQWSHQIPIDVAQRFKIGLFLSKSRQLFRC